MTGAIAIAMVGAIAGVGSGVIIVAMTGAIAMTLAQGIVRLLARSLALAFAYYSFAGPGPGSRIMAVVVALAVTLVGAYIGWQALEKGQQDSWVRSIAIALAAMGGTSFRGAILTDTDFSQARLKSTDFRRAVLCRTCWRDAEKLYCVRPGNTYLNNPKVRRRLLSGEVQP